MAKQGTVGSSRVFHRPRVLPIERIEEETSAVKSFYVDFPEVAAAARPGQFVMVWVLGVDEVPMSVSGVKRDRMRITVAKVGDATAALHNLKEGDSIGIRGPCGNSFDLSGENILMVAGGCGVAPLAFAAETATSAGKDVTVILGAKKARDLMFRSEFEALGAELAICTDDGSAGTKGFATDMLPRVLAKKEFDSCLTCGPEVMMAKVAKKVGIPVQVSLERYMKCGLGLCGQCCVDPSGVRVCVDGPVFPADQLRGGEFGKYARDAAGVKREPLSR